MNKLFTRFWCSCSPLDVIDSIRSFDAVVPISYGTLKNSLTMASRENFIKAMCFLSKNDLDTKFVFASSSHPFRGAESIETSFKLDICNRGGVDAIVADPVFNTVDEAIKIKQVLNDVGLSPKKILVITGQIHSRSVRYVWGKIFPDSDVFIYCTSSVNETQRNHTIKNLRTPFKWIISNILRHLALMVLPLSIVRRVRHQ